MSGHPYPGNTLRLRPYRVTGVERFGNSDGPRYLTTEGYSWSGRPARGGDATARTFPIPCTPHMYGLLSEQSDGEYFGEPDREPVLSRPWCQPGGFLTAPPRGVVVIKNDVITQAEPDSSAWHEAFVAALRSAMQDDFQAQNVFVACYRTLRFAFFDICWPGVIGVPATGFADREYAHAVSFPDDINGGSIDRENEFVIPSPAVDPNLWRGREILLVYVTPGGAYATMDDEFQWTNLGTEEEPDWWVSGYYSDIFNFADTMDDCQGVLETMGGGMFRRFAVRCAHVASYQPYDGSGGNELASAETSWLSNVAALSDQGLANCQAVVEAAGGEVESFPNSASPAQVAQQVNSWAREFFGL